jgi:WD40 repeat protein/class 3 adenylate cyclase
MAGEDPQVAEGEAGADDAQIRTFLIADVRGYTVFTQERGDEAAAVLAGKFATVARGILEARGGTHLELRGDEVLAVFDSARQAIRAAIELQRRFVDETVSDPTLPLAVGIGLDAGEAVAVDGGFRGGALNLAARLCGIAAPAEILASPAVTHLARKVEGVAYIDRGTVNLKGLADPVQVIRLRAEANDAADDMAFRRALGSRAARLTPAVPGAIVANPYKGLRAFEEGDAVDFFGREELVEELVKRVKQTRFLAVVGPSGSGKSSVVRAGLIPALRRGAIAGSEGWHIADMFPGAHPLDGLEAALLRAAPNPPTSLMDQLERDEHGLHRAVLRLLQSDGSELVLVIDQFEEVFTLVEDEAERTHFLGSLEAAASDPRSRVRIVATLRADFYDRPLLYRGFAELFKSRVEAVIPLSAEELERAISGPAKRVDVSLEPGLVAAMLADVAEEPGALPLMEYALTELFERRDGRTLFLEAYREIGRISGALGRRAEELYAELADGGKEAARQLFLRLVALGEGTEDTRRRVPRAEVASLDVDQQAMATVLDTYGASRQLSFDRDAGTRAPTIELAHEAMLTAWPRLHRWIDVAREDLRTERRVAAAAREWSEAGQDPSFLLGGSRLEQSETWQATSGLAVTPEEREYLDASRAERERRTADEVARLAHEEELERRSFQRLRALVAVLAFAALIAIGLTVFATTQRGRAQREERTAAARELAAASVANLDVDPERSILLALEAIHRTRSVDGTILPEAEEALHRAVTVSRTVITIPGVGGALDWSPQGVFVTEGPEDTGIVDIRDAKTGETVQKFKGHDIDINDVQFSADGSMLATVGDDGALKVWDPETGHLLSAVSGEGSAFGPSFNADGSRLSASWPDEGVIRIVDPSSGEVTRTIMGAGPDPFIPFDTSLSPDGRRVVASNIAGTDALVFDARSGEPLLDLRGHAYNINWVAWSPDGGHIGTASNDASARVWDAETGRLEAELLGHTGGLITVDWAPDSDRLVTAATDGTAKVWEFGGGGGHELLSLSAEETRSGTLAAFSPDGTRVITGGGGSVTAVKIWDVSLAGDAEVRNFPADELASVDVAFLPGDRVVASIDRGSVALWDVRSGRRIRTIGPGSGSPEPVVRVAVNSEGTRVAMLRKFSSTASAWDVETGERLFEVGVGGSELGGVEWGGEDRLMVWSYDGTAKVFDRDGAEVTSVGRNAGFDIDAAAFSPDGSHVVAEGRQQDSSSALQTHMIVWDTRSGRTIHSVPIPGGLTFVAFDPAGRTVTAARTDGEVEVREVESGRLVGGFSADPPSPLPPLQRPRPRPRLQPRRFPHRDRERRLDRPGIRRAPRGATAGPARPRLPRLRGQLQP